MRMAFPSEVKERIIDKLIESGRIATAEEELYNVTGSLVYEWRRDTYQFGVRVPSVIEWEPAVVQYVTRVARALGIGGKPYRTVYLTGRESALLVNEIQLECPTLFRQLRHAARIL